MSTQRGALIKGFCAGVVATALVAIAVELSASRSSISLDPTLDRLVGEVVQDVPENEPILILEGNGKGLLLKVNPKAKLLIGDGSEILKTCPVQAPEDWKPRLFNTQEGWTAEERTSLRNASYYLASISPEHDKLLGEIPMLKATAEEADGPHGLYDHKTGRIKLQPVVCDDYLVAALVISHENGHARVVGRKQVNVYAEEIRQHNDDLNTIALMEKEIRERARISPREHVQLLARTAQLTVSTVIMLREYEIALDIYEVMLTAADNRGKLAPLLDAEHAKGLEALEKRSERLLRSGVRGRPSLKTTADCESVAAVYDELKRLLVDLKILDQDSQRTLRDWHARMVRNLTVHKLLVKRKQ